MTAIPSKAEVLERLPTLEEDEIYDAVARMLLAKDKLNAAPSCCPNCGHDWRSGLLLDRDGFVIDPRGQIFFEGNPAQSRKSGW
jgi:hypothetical protein